MKKLPTHIGVVSYNQYCKEYKKFDEEIINLVISNMIYK